MKRIKLTKGQVTIVDDSDYEWLSQWKWSAVKAYKGEVYYSYRCIKIDGKWTTTPMHRVIMNTPKGLVVDHIDGNPLNNQRSNLRNCTISQNNMNCVGVKASYSKYKGVTWNKKTNRYHSVITINSKNKNLGTFETELEAAIIVNIAMRKHYGEYARTNILTPTL